MMVPPEAVPALMRDRLGCPHCASLVDTLENLLDDMPGIGVSRDVHLHDDGGYTVIWQRSYIDALVELRKHRPCPPSCLRCALCDDTGRLMVEGRRGPIVSMACPNCAGGGNEAKR